MKLEIQDYRELSEENQTHLFNNYVLKLSKYKEAYTNINEIKNAMINDKDFYIYAVINVSNDDFLGHIQFKHLTETNTIIVDYICLNNSIYTKNIYGLINNILIQRFDYNQLVSEITFFDTKRNKALEKVFKKYGFIISNFKYIQPPTESIFPVFGKLLILKQKETYNFNSTIKDIYINHYVYWYKHRLFYSVYIRMLYQLQKYFLKKGQINYE